jgi:hypothetical protein
LAASAMRQSMIMKTADEAKANSKTSHLDTYRHPRTYSGSRPHHHIRPPVLISLSRYLNKRAPRRLDWVVLPSWLTHSRQSRSSTPDALLISRCSEDPEASRRGRMTDWGNAKRV